MAVYTDLSEEACQAFLTDFYDIGPLFELQGIAEGIQNTNFYLKTKKGEFILTIVERRTPEADLPFFFDYMAHLAGKGFPCPEPVNTKKGGALARIKEKPAAIVTFLPGKANMTPTPDQCFAAGAMIAELHLAGGGFHQTRENLFSAERVAGMFNALQEGIAETWPGLETFIADEIAFQESQDYGDLPTGPIHTDIFPDNVFFEGNKVTGLIDFYFASTDILGYDLAIALGCWCFDKDGKLKADHFQKMLAGYESKRALSGEEKNALPGFLRRASLAFLMTRAEDVIHPPPNILGVQKDPMEYRKILETQQKRRHIEDYWKGVK